MTETSTKNILIIDDERGMREGMRRLLQMLGYNVETAETGSSGAALGIAKEYDIYFIDLKMPDISGEQVLLKIKTRYPEAICVIITAYASIDTAVNTTRLGAYQYIPKPFTPEELELLVQRAMDKRWYILEARRLRQERESRLLELVNEQSRLRTIINALDDGILVVNNEGQVVLFNPGFLKLMDIKTEIRLGQHILDFLHKDLREQIETLLVKPDTVTAIKQEIVVFPPANLVVMANITPILKKKSEMLGIVAVIRDITELKKLDLLKSQFINMAAHELKSPLTAIQGYLEMVVNKTLGDSPDTYENYMDRSLTRTKALVNLINDLLNITRLESGRVRREFVKTSISGIITECFKSLQDDIHQECIDVKLELDDKITIQADRDDIYRIFRHLLENAVKYNRKNGRIHVRMSKEGHYALVSVQDTGIGLKEDEKNRLFEEFFRAKNDLTRRIAGTGLGLTIVKKLVDSYAGKIQVESQFEHGSTFSIYLPIG
ncbi:response regulator [candidate division KSB1 bacterium]|nr:response regulator [candidate division KSB1 bacterium]